MTFRAALFDIYGTLLKSSAGELHPDPALRAEIARAHAASPHPFPEVDIREIHTALHPELSSEEIERLALVHEQRVNPATAMPGAVEALRGLAEAGVVLGLISNAQFYTVPVLESCLGASIQELGIDPALCVFSYRERRAKPDSHLFELVRERLMERGISPREVLYIGNDVRNDIDPAKATGFRTALFAGDDGSLRLRGRTLVDSGADRVIVSLAEVTDILGFR